MKRVSFDPTLGVPKSSDEVEQKIIWRSFQRQSVTALPRPLPKALSRPVQPTSARVLPLVLSHMRLRPARIHTLSSSQSERILTQHDVLMSPCVGGSKSVAERCHRSNFGGASNIGALIRPQSPAPVS